MIDNRPKGARPRETAETRRETTARSAVLGRELRNMYRDIAKEPIPPEFRRLLQQRGNGDES